MRKNKEKADKWFTPQRAEQAMAKYGSEPIVERFEVLKDPNFLKKDFDFKSDKTATILVKGLSEKDLKEYTKNSLGLLHGYFVRRRRRDFAFYERTDSGHFCEKT